MSMSKHERSKTKDWEQFNAAADPEITVDVSAGSVAQEDIASATPLTHLSYEDLEAQLLKTETALEEHKSQLIQLKEQDTYRFAEMENMRRRCKLDVENAYKFSLEKFIRDLLPVKDSLEAALIVPGTATEHHALLEGVKLTLQALQKVLENNGVQAINPSSGDLFDAHYHHAMLAEESGQHGSNTIIRVLQKGYLLNERLMRPAMVVVTKAIEDHS